MPIKLAAIVPHPPVLIPSIGKENILQLEKTRSTYAKIEEALLEEKIETIILISSHGSPGGENFFINIGDEFEINFEEFGDFSAKIKVNGDLELAQTIREDLIENDQVKAINQPILDHGCGVPLYLFLSGGQNIASSGELAKKIEIVTIHVSNASPKDHFELGKIIRERIKKGRKKIAVIASGDLSHTVAKNSPAGYSPKGAKFDQKLIEYLQGKKYEEIINFDEDLIAGAKPCGLKSIAMLLGMLDGSAYDIASTSYESPFGIGHLTMLLKPFF
jgi:aromatic ring-opening dioxygenase LigB subunit